MPCCMLHVPQAPISLVVLAEGLNGGDEGLGGLLIHVLLSLHGSNQHSMVHGKLLKVVSVSSRALRWNGLHFLRDNTDI